MTILQNVKSAMQILIGLHLVSMRRNRMTIEHRHGHYVVLDDNGNVYCECDTHKEAMEEIADMEDK